MCMKAEKRGAGRKLLGTWTDSSDDERGQGGSYIATIEATEATASHEFALLDVTLPKSYNLNVLHVSK